MRCLYYLSPNLDISKKISDDLHAENVDDWYLHVISKNESGLSRREIHSSNYLETLDVVRSGSIGAMIGIGFAILAVLLMGIFQPFGPGVPATVYVMVFGVITLFGVWEGGLFGIDTENKKLEKFHDDLEDGKDLILIYASEHQEAVVRDMMGQKHPESGLVAIDKHFINPFYRLERISSTT